MTSTRKDKKWYTTCDTHETVEGTLKSLGSLLHSYGSDVHAVWGLQIAYTPEWARDVQRKLKGGANP